MFETADNPQKSARVPALIFAVVVVVVVVNIKIKAVIPCESSPGRLRL